MWLTGSFPEERPTLLLLLTTNVLWLEFYNSFFLWLFDFWWDLTCAVSPPSILKTLLQVVHNALSGSLAFKSHENCSSHFMEYKVLSCGIFLLFCLIIWSKTKNTDQLFPQDTNNRFDLSYGAIYSILNKMTRSNPKGLYDFLDFRILGKQGKF